MSFFDLQGRLESVDFPLFAMGQNRNIDVPKVTVCVWEFEEQITPRREPAVSINHEAIFIQKDRVDLDVTGVLKVFLQVSLLG